MLKQIYYFLRGFAILVMFYIISLFIIKSLHIMLPPAILGLILFAVSLVLGIVKEEWIETTANVLIKNMAMFIVPFMGGLVVYKSLLVKNIFVILFVTFTTTTLLIIITGLFVEFGLKFMRKLTHE